MYTHTHTHTSTEGGHSVLVQLSSVSSCTCLVICLTDGSLAWLTKGFPRHTRPSLYQKDHLSVRGYHDRIRSAFQNAWQDIFPNEVSFSLLLLVMYLRWHGNMPPLPPPFNGRQREWELHLFRANPSYERDSSYSESQLWSPTEEAEEKKKKKRLSYVDGPLFLSPTSPSLGSSLASLPRRSVMSEDEVNEVVQGGMQHTWKSDLTRLWSKLECDSFVLLANSLRVKMHINAYTKHRHTDCFGPSCSSHTLCVFVSFVCQMRPKTK